MGRTRAQTCVVIYVHGIYARGQSPDCVSDPEGFEGGPVRRVKEKHPSTLRHMPNRKRTARTSKEQPSCHTYTNPRHLNINRKLGARKKS